MARNLKESEIEECYQLIQDGKKVKEVCAIMNKTPFEVNQLYNAGVRRTWAHYQERMAKAKTKNPVVLKKQAKPQSSYQRPPSAYSNHSPYGIAS